MANRNPTEFDSAVVTSSGHSVKSALHSMQLFRSWKTRAHRGMRYPNVTWRISSYMITWLPHCHCTSGPEYFLSKAHMLHIIDVVLRKALVYLRRLLSTLRILSINYYLFCSLPLHKICALCDIISAIFVLLTTENTDDLEIRVPERLIRWKLHPWIPRVSFPISH